MNICTTYDLDQTVWVLYLKVVWMGKIALIHIKPGTDLVYVIDVLHRGKNLRILSIWYDKSQQLIFPSYDLYYVDYTRRQIADLLRRLQIQRDNLAKYLAEHN